MTRPDPVHLAMIGQVARALDELLPDVVFVGGTTVSFYVDDPVIIKFRPTMDVDCVIDVGTYLERTQIEEKLRSKGFVNCIEDNVICRYELKGLKVDIMPTDEKILGFTNIWYREGFENSVERQLFDDIKIKIFSTPYFLASKMEAFKGRGNGDFTASHDLEDFITVLDGRLKLTAEDLGFTGNLRDYIQKEFTTLLNSEPFLDRVSGYIDPVYSRVRQIRVKRILDFMKSLL